MSAAFQSNKRWRNHGRNLEGVVARYYEPTTTEEIQEIVREARRNGAKVRVVGDSHSWSPLGETRDYLICTLRMNRILDISASPPRIVVEPGVTVGDTLDAFMRNGVCLPMNVDLPTITIGGAVAVGANGFSRHWGPYSEFLEEVELVTGTGEIMTIRRDRDGDLWRAAACGLGLFGVFTKITLSLQPDFKVRVVNQKIERRRAIDDVGRVFASHDYAQYFWFPFNLDVTLQTSDVTTDPATWTRAMQGRKTVKGWFETGATHLVKPILTTFPAITPYFTAFAGASLKAGELVMGQSENMLLGRWIDYMEPSLNASVSFLPGEDCIHAREGWNIATDLLDEFARAGRYPANLAMNMRVFGRNSALLHSVDGANNDLTCNIQITSFANKDWEPFKNELMARWLELPGSRPHWAKQYQDLPGIAERLRAVYGENLRTFLRVREQSGVDPEKLFVNPFLEGLFFSGEAGATSPS